MKRTLGLALLILAIGGTSTGCTKNKKRADRLEEELLRCRAAVQQLESSEMSREEQAEFAALNCGECEGGAP